MLFRPAESSKDIVDFYRRYLLSTFKTNRDYYNKQMEEHLSKDGVISNGPFISMSDSFEKDMSIRDLVQDGVLCKSMLSLKNSRPDRRLYKHQVEAIKKAVNGSNLVITTGTGSGKTECFLLPVINQLFKEKEEGCLDSGIRTLIIYPMNALVNDQIRRLREIFEGYAEEDITFGKFTGETQEKTKDAENEYYAREGKRPRKNELISREQMRENPPHILITNYAMLEYLLLRPGDNVFFNQSGSNKWKSIVLDEAHTYGGATGIEVGSLLKRVTAMLNRSDIQFLLTSATLGSRSDDSKIVKFAESLCNSAFNTKSIIRSTTIPPERPGIIKELDFDIYKTLAVHIRDNYAHEATLEYLRKVGVDIIRDEDIEVSLEKTLYNMILHDSFYYEVRNSLLNQTKPLNQLSIELGRTTSDITDFIAVASNAQIDGDKIFEARYHMFLRGIEGVFVTLSPSDKLFVKKMETYKEPPFSEDDEYKAYEISFCHNCEAIFIVGQTSSDGRLVQISKYSDDYSPEVFLLDGDYEPEAEEDEDEAGNRYLVCSKCGTLCRDFDNAEPACGHGKKYYNRVIKVKEKGAILNSCPCCHAINTQRSILRPYFLGNEAATAVIATGLYDVLPDTKITKTIEKSEDIYFGTGTTNSVRLKEEHLVKQFLTFSDNRQAAAFFASYLENTYRTGLLKRMMTLVKEENKSALDKGVSLSFFVSKLEEMMREHKVFTDEELEKEAWLSVASEIINYKARNSLQNEGILFFDVDIEMPENNTLNLTAKETTELFKIMVLFFLKDGAFKVPVHLTPADYKSFSFGSQLNGYSKDYSTASYTKSWLPKEDKQNIRTRLIKKVFPEQEDVRGILDAIWNVLEKNAIIVYDGGLGKHVINLDRVRVKSVDKLYRCEECKSVTPYYFTGICTCNNCNGKLVPYDVELVKKNDHYKYLYDNLKIDTLVAKEHTAQLGSQKAYDYQNQFKNEKINVLSCSTTFEMGVDVGTLETVFMRNMPPSPANYAQRAGRAGRSVKSAAYALTYCPNNSHDLNFFKNPVSMIKGTITPPAFNVNNEKIVLRHIFASAFSFFWRKHRELYKKKVGDFFDNDGIETFRTYLLSEPEDLKDYLKRVVSLDLQQKFEVDEFGWIKLLFSGDDDNPGVFDIAEKKYNSDLNQLIDAQKTLNKELEQLEAGTKEYNRTISKIRSVSYSIQTIKKEDLIAFLSKNNLIPKYGFPVDTVDLNSVGNSYLDSLKLDRDLSSAISEYAPESQVVADGKLITSRYVRRLGEYEWPKFNYCFCDHCKTLNKTIWIEDLPQDCKQCGHTLKKKAKHQYIIPKFGFIVDNKEPEPVGTSKPERTYKGSIAYIGDGEKIDNHEYSVCGKRVVIGTSKMDELAVLNTSDFYVCNECGFGIIKDGCYDLIVKQQHQKSDGYRCSNKELTPYALGHEFQTDVVQIRFESENIVDSDRAWTILYALLEGLSKCLNIDRNELAGCLHWYKNPLMGGIGNYDFIIFDNTPGGAGYVRSLRDTKTISSMMREGLRIVSECTCGGDAADTACYSCLCNYYNQKQHDILQRKFAIEFFNSMKNGREEWETSRISSEIGSEGEKTIAVYCDDGQDQSSMKYNEIWEYLKEDTELQDEADFIMSLYSSIPEDREKPIYNGSIKVPENDEVIATDLLWKKSKVALFLSANSDEYERAKVTDWRVFSTKEGFEPAVLGASIIGG